MSVTLSLHRRWTCRPVRTSLVCFARPPALSYFFISFLSPYRRPCRRLSGSSRPTQQQQQKAFIIVCKRDVKKRTHLFALQVSLSFLLLLSRPPSFADWPATGTCLPATHKSLLPTLHKFLYCVAGGTYVLYGIHFTCAEARASEPKQSFRVLSKLDSPGCVDVSGGQGIHRSGPPHHKLTGLLLLLLLRLPSTWLSSPTR